MNTRTASTPIARPAPPTAPPTGSMPTASSPLRLDARVRTALVRRDRDHLADALATFVAHVVLDQTPGFRGAPVLRDQVLLARGVLLDVEHALRGDGPVDPRGVRAVEELLDAARHGRLAPFDLLALDAGAREARRLLGRPGPTGWAH
jgi:hypothetical protein